MMYAKSADEFVLNYKQFEQQANSKESEYLKKNWKEEILLDKNITIDDDNNICIDIMINANDIPTLIINNAIVQ